MHQLIFYFFPNRLICMVQLIPISNIPCRMPNGLQWAGNELFVMDQYTDNVYVINERGSVIREFETVTENGSGITVGGGYLWTASNGDTTARSKRPTDTDSGTSYINKLDLETGKLVDRFLTPDRGGIHGIEWDDGFMWVTGFNPKAIILVDTTTFSIVKKISVNLDVLHGLARDGNGIWCADRKERVIVKFDVETGKEIARITFPDDAPDPHGLSIKNQELWYADAAFPEPRPSRDYPEIGKIRL